MSQNFELHGQARTQYGKSVSRRLRRLDNQVPAVVYGAGKETVSIALEHNLVSHALQNEGFYSHILTLNVDGKSEKVVLKAVQRHPYKPVIMHMDFMRVKANEKLHMHIPLHFLNEEKAPGVKAEGVVTHHMNEIEVACLPANLPEFIEIDLAKLELNESIHLSDLKLPKGVEIVALTHGENHDAPIVTIHTPRAHEEPETPVTEITSEVTEGEEAAAPEQAEGENSAENPSKE